MKRRAGKSTFFCFFVLALSLPCAGALAQGEPFYKGKTIRVVTGFGPGDVDDQWPRLIGPIMTKYIPGNPNVVVQNMAGAGSMVAANYVYGVAKPDGLTLGWISPGIYIDQLHGENRGSVRLDEVFLDRLSRAKQFPDVYARGCPLQDD